MRVIFRIVLRFSCSFLAWGPQFLCGSPKEFTPQPLVTYDPIPRAPAQATTHAADFSDQPPAAPPRSPLMPNSDQDDVMPPASALHRGAAGSPPDREAFKRPSARDVEPFNEAVLRVIGKMPQGGGYAISARANANLRRSIKVDKLGNLSVDPKLAEPSFCSGATYLALLLALEELENSRCLKLGKSAQGSLLHKAQADGAGVWGRWNANGPGVARLFHELHAGESFVDIDRAKPGDFLKIWWTDEIGAKEKGHLVVYLGQREGGSDGKLLRFWSSNSPDGYGSKEIPVSKAKRLLFSRLLRPEAFQSADKLPPKDEFLSSMLTKSCSMDEMLKMAGIRPD